MKAVGQNLAVARQRQVEKSRSGTDGRVVRMGPRSAAFEWRVPIDAEKRLTATSRRRFLRESGALAGGAIVASVLAGNEALAGSEVVDNLPPNVPEWMKTPGDPMGSQLLRGGIARTIKGRRLVVRLESCAARGIP
jgi:capsid protein